MVFPAVYDLAGPMLANDAIVVVKMRVRSKDDGLDLHATEITLPPIDTSRSDAPVVVSMPVARCTADTVGSFKQILAAHPGSSEVHLRLHSNSGVKTMRLDAGLRVAQSSALVADLKELLGPGCLA